MIGMLANQAGHWVYNWVFGLGGIGAVISVGLWAAWYFSPLAKIQLLHAAITATGITLASTYLSSHYYNIGYRTAINHIASQNKEASDAVKKAISNVDQCESVGGDWDTTTGRCSQ